MSKKLRWKKHPASTGLASVGAGPYRASDYHDGVEEYGTVYPHGGNWRGPLIGWYFCGNMMGNYVNTCNSPFKTEKEAKEFGAKWVKKILSERES